MPDFGSQSMPRSARRSPSSSGDAGSLTRRFSPRAAGPIHGAPRGIGSSAGAWSFRRNTSASTACVGFVPSARIRSGTHGRLVGMTKWTGMESPTRSPRARARLESNSTAMKMGLRLA